MPTIKNLLILKPEKLLTHPRNMRRFYPSDQVREMANSIAANKGVIEPLIVIRADKDNKYIVIDGNMRLAGARLLGKDCPPLEAKVVRKSKAEQLLIMIAANKVRYDVDPVSEGLHYKSLRDEGLTVRKISKQTGVYEARISNRVVLADLDEPIQKLIVDGKLPADARIARALLSLPTSKRLKLAERLAQNPSIKIKTILSACDRLASKTPSSRKLKHPARELSGADAGGSAKIRDIREAAQITCHKCSQYEGKIAKNPEPAWSMIVHAADDNCRSCSLRDMQSVCASCPAVELLRKMVGAKK